MIDKVHIKPPRLIAGMASGLDQKTGLVTLVVEGWNTPVDAVIMLEDQALSQLLPTLGRIRTTSAFGCFADLIISLTIDIQREAGDPAFHGKILDLSSERIELALPWERPDVMPAALKWALRHLLVWTRNGASVKDRCFVDAAYFEWIEKTRKTGLQRSNLHFALSALARDWPVRVEHANPHIGWGEAQLHLDGCFTGQTNLLAARTANNKFQTKQILLNAGLPVASAFLVGDNDAAARAAEKLGWPLVVKPLNQEQARGVVTGIRSDQQLQAAFTAANKLSPGQVIVEQHMYGSDHRLLVVKGQLLVAARRSPATVVGDGISTVQELIDDLNRDPRRGRTNWNLMALVDLVGEAMACLEEQGLSAESVPAAGRAVQIARTANISSGGTANDVTDIIHPDNRLLAERAARMVGLDIAGIDFLCSDISRSWMEIGGAICEVNGQPGLRPHWLSEPDRDLTGEILDLIFEGRNPRIPIVAVTSGKLGDRISSHLHQCLSHAGLVTGLSNGLGFWVGKNLVAQAPPTSPKGAAALLSDPAVQAAVFTLNSSAISATGLPCDRHAVSVIAECDEGDLEGLIDLVNRTSQAVVINIDAAACRTVADEVPVERLILVSDNPDDSRLQHHCRAGGRAVTRGVENARAPVLIQQNLIEVIDEVFIQKNYLSDTGIVSLLTIAAAAGLGW